MTSLQEILVCKPRIFEVLTITHSLDTTRVIN